MPNPELNKIFAAILVAGIVAMLASFVSRLLVHPEIPEKDAVFVAGGVPVSSGEPQKPQGPEPILHLIASADITRGEKLSRACAACHSFDKGGVNKIGPNLWNVVGAKKGHLDSFSYSEALLSMGGSWDYEALNHFMWKPKAYIPGTKMNYIGLRKPEDRAAMIAWLRTLADSPIALPEVAEPPQADDGAENAPQEGGE